MFNMLQHQCAQAAVILGLLVMPVLGDSAPTKSVKQDGTGDYKTVQAAVDAVPDKNQQPTVIEIFPGRYQERVLVPRGKDFITLMGTGSSPNDVWVGEGKGQAPLTVHASNFRAENFTVENTAGQIGPQNALFADGKKQVFERMVFDGWQDTAGIWDGCEAYFHNCDVRGSVDFIYSGGTAVFDHCNVIERRSDGGPVAAPSTPKKVPFGLVFLDCHLVKGEGVSPNTSSLMRPWLPNGQTAFINCVMDDHITDRAWDPWDGRENTCRAAEYGSKTPSGTSIDLSKRAAWVQRLTAAQAAAYTPAKIFNGWDPTNSQ